MITPEEKAILESLRATQYGRVLRKYLDERFTEIGNIMETQSWEETLGRKFAIKLLRDLFAFMEQKEDPQKRLGQYD